MSWATLRLVADNSQPCCEASKSLLERLHHYFVFTHHGCGDGVLYLPEPLIELVTEATELASDIADQLPSAKLCDLIELSVRRDFAAALCASSRFNQLLEKPSFQALQAFHSENKYLLMAYSYNAYKKLGPIVANRQLPLTSQLQQYRAGFFTALTIPAELSRQANALEHMLGYLPKETVQRAEIHAQVQAYRLGESTIEPLLQALKLALTEHGSDYIRRQSYLNGWPHRLLE